MLQIKKQRESNELRKKEYEQQVKFENSKRHNEILLQKQLAEQRKKEMIEHKMRMYKMQCEKRVKAEEEARAKKETAVLELEKIEQELIKKLQFTQNVQKSAYEELETALASSPDEFAKKFPVRDLSRSRVPKSSRISLSPIHRDSSARGLSENARNVRSYKVFEKTNQGDLSNMSHKINQSGVYGEKLNETSAAQTDRNTGAQALYRMNQKHLAKIRSQENINSSQTNVQNTSTQQVSEIKGWPN